MRSQKSTRTSQDDLGICKGHNIDYNLNEIYEKSVPRIPTLPWTPYKKSNNLVSLGALKTCPSTGIPLCREIGFTHYLFPTRDEYIFKDEEVVEVSPTAIPPRHKNNCDCIKTTAGATKPSYENRQLGFYGDLQRNNLSQRYTNKEEKSLYSKINYFRKIRSNEMGWSQPVVGKRVRQSESDENENNESVDPDNSTEDMKGTFNKRPREISPKRSPGIMDFNNDSNIQQRMPLMTMGCELSNRPSSDTTTNNSSSYTNTTASETEIFQSSSPSSQYSMYNRPEYTRRKSREKSGGEESSPNNNSSFKSLSLTDQIPFSCTSFDEVDSASPVLNSEIMPTALRGVLVSRKGPRMVAGSRSNSSLRGIPKPLNSRSTASTSDSSTSFKTPSSTGTSETTSETTEGDTDYEDKTEYLVEEEGDDISESTDFMPPFQIPTKVVPAIRPSYFPNVPPYINFCLHDEQCEALPHDIRKYLKWRLSPITPNIIKKTVNNTGFRLLRKTVEWDGQWGKHMKAALFRTSLKDYQKLNHLPATFQIGRKDRLWRNFHRFMLKFGREEFGFLPRTYILPQELKQLKQAWEAGESKGKPWIVKPPAAARGTGIRVCNKWSQIPKKRPVVVQKYISNPLLINERKFDLRLYVLVTSFNPLKVYMYNDGLVRFAPVKYSQDAKRVSDRFMHLTNYSVNKNCELYTHNEDADACKGHKWTLKTLWRHLTEEGKDVSKLLEQIEDIVIKTLLCAEDAITAASFSLPNRYNGYELFGFDIILDHKLKPWLLEVNISPSLHSSSPLDLAVKGELVKEVFNIVGYHLPTTLPASTKKIFVGSLDITLDQDNPVFDKRLYTNVVSKEEKTKHQTFKAIHDVRKKYLSDIIKTLTPDDVRQLITAEDELSQCHGFTRIFPTLMSHIYFPFFEGPRYYNLLLDAWEQSYHDDRARGIERIKELCRAKIHLQVTASSKNPISENPTIMALEKLNPVAPIVVTTTEEEEVIKDESFLLRDGIGDEGQKHQNNMFTPGLSVNCHDEALSSTNRNTNQPPVSDYIIKSVC